MNRDDRLEGERIQDGLERFVDKEINVIGATPAKKEVRVERDLDVIGGAADISDKFKASTFERRPNDDARIRQTERSVNNRAGYSRSVERHPDAEERRQSVIKDDRRFEEDDMPRRYPEERAPGRYPDERIPRRYEEDRAPRRYAQERPSRRYEDERPVRRYRDDEFNERERKLEKKIRKNRKKSKKEIKQERKLDKKQEKKLEKLERLEKKENNKKKKSGFKRFIIVILILLLIFIGALYSLVGRSYDKMKYERIDSVASKPLKQDGVYNILLIGNDSRLNGEDGRSDAMILLSISNKTKKIMMTSFLRDMYVDIPGHDGNRINAAYSYGGPELLMQTIEQNFGIPVNRYVLVNFEAFANLVDAVGGVDLELSNEEVKLVNGYLMEYNQLRNMDLTTDWLDENASGMLHLNGPQALAYTRNRYIGTDFGRTERQRKVLSEVFKKLPTAGVKNYDDVSDGVFTNLTTNLTKGECLSLSLNAEKLALYDMEQQTIPAEGTYKDATIRGMMVLEVDKEANKAILNETIYAK